MAAMDEIAPRLYLGDAAAARDLSALQLAGISHILIAARECQPQFPADFTYFKVPAKDNLDCDVSAFLSEACRFIEAGREGGGVLVHCFAGMSRSASLVIAYLMKTEGVDAFTALERVKAKRPIVSPNTAFLKQLQAWGETIGISTVGVKCGNCGAPLCAQSSISSHAEMLGGQGTDDCMFFFIKSIDECRNVSNHFPQVYCSHCGEELGNIEPQESVCVCGATVPACVRLIKLQCSL